MRKKLIEENVEIDGKKIHNFKNENGKVLAELYGEIDIDILAEFFYKLQMRETKKDLKNTK